MVFRDRRFRVLMKYGDRIDTRERLSNEGANLSLARNSTNAHNFVNCSISSYGDCPVRYDVRLSSLNSESFVDGLMGFFSVAGCPDRIFSKGSYDAVDYVLGCFGKITRKTPWGFLVGRRVVDSEE